jgi:hypothetical protein
MNAGITKKYIIVMQPYPTNYFGENNTFNTNIKKILMHIFVILNVYFHPISNELIPSICVLICDMSWLFALHNKFVPLKRFNATI